MKFSIEDAISYGWNTTTKNFKALITPMMVFVLLYVVYGAILMQLPEDAIGAIFGIEVLFGLAVFVIVIGFMWASLHIVSGSTPVLKDFFWSHGVFLRSFAVGIVYQLIILAGFILLIIPGIYWAVKYMFAAWIVVDQKLDPFAALSLSRKITAGVWWPLLGFNVVCLLINVVGLLLFGVGLLFTIPMTYIAEAYVYRALLKAHEEPAVVGTVDSPLVPLS